MQRPSPTSSPNKAAPLKQTTFDGFLDKFRHQGQQSDQGGSLDDNGSAAGSTAMQISSSSNRLAKRPKRGQLVHEENGAIDASDSDEDSLYARPAKRRGASSPSLVKQESSSSFTTASAQVAASGSASTTLRRGRSQGLEASEFFQPKLTASRNSGQSAGRVIKRSSTRSPSVSGSQSPSKYSHLRGIPDALSENLIFMVVGTNPGVMTATTGHAYAHPSNRFWKFLYESGCTSRQVRPEEDQDMPRLFSIGLTNIVSRPSKTGAELTKQEMREGVKALDEKAARYKPQAVVILGIEIWKEVWFAKMGKAIKQEERKFGWQDPKNPRLRFGKGKGFEGVPVFLATSTSGLATHPPAEEKARIWKVLGEWTQERRKERDGGGVVKGEEVEAVAPEQGMVKEEEEA